MIQDRPGEALPTSGNTQVHVPALACPGEINRAAITSPTSHVAGGTGDRWLILAAKMAGLANSSGRLLPEPVPAGRACLPRIATCTPGEGAGSVRAARDFTVATLRRWGVAERSHDIATVVSELLTNALRHALPGSGEAKPRRPIRLGLLHLRPCLLCAVADPTTVAPAPRSSGALGETGRGLHIVCALSDRWGYATSGSGKVVWAMFTAQLTEPCVSGSDALQTLVSNHHPQVTCG